jgi:hypothetical protein
VVGQLQLDVLISRLEAEYKVEAVLEPSPFDTARWLKGSPEALKAFADFNLSISPRTRWRSGVPGALGLGRGLPAGAQPRAGLFRDQGR